MRRRDWQRIKELFETAIALEGGQRTAFVSKVSAQDNALGKELNRLLAHHDMAESFLEQPPVVLDPGPAEIYAGEPEPVAPEEPNGKRIGRYTLTALVGKGGMGAVYRAVREDDFRMEVAIKLLKRGTDTEAALSRFRTERQILASLQHPNIARLLDGGTSEAGLPYFVMEYVDGTPLLEYAAPLSVRARLELFRSICSAVQYAHRNLIVHRDIKPANILVTSDGIPKLLDFGIAKLLDPLRKTL